MTDGDVNAIKMPATVRDIAGVLRIVADGSDCFAVIEQVHSMPKQGVSSTFKFGKMAGWVEAAIGANS